MKSLWIATLAAIVVEATDEVGNFPLPGNGNVPAAFSVVPLPATGKSYTLSITAAGFDRTPVALTANGGALKCTPSTKTGACNIHLSHGLMSGNVSLGSGTVAARSTARPTSLA